MSGVIPSPVQLTCETDCNFPAVILWNPYIIYPSVFPMKCTLCGNSMFEAYWNDGSSSSKQPRTIHGIDDIVLLVSAVYTCEKRHKTLAHDEIVLKQLPEPMIPFCLLHKTGFTKELVDLCVALCRQGINFYSMESLILEKRWECFAKKQELLAVNKQTQASCSYTEFLASSMSQSPSNDVLSKCFLTRFLQHEELYLHEMEAIPVTESISFDHTFKIASNIGYLREDKKWISQYDSVFLVLNKDGKVLTWQLTKGTSFDQITTVLQGVAQRAQGNLKVVYVDDCCKLRHKIMKVFGSNVVVKLDLFHAVQRITKTLPKKHSLYKNCRQELRLVFRCKGDCEMTRLSSTPSAAIIQENLDNFVIKWKDATDLKGENLFKPETLSAIKNLKQHISAGCLSDIPPGGGTNKNERLHEHIKNYFNRSRIGILLAYSLLHMIIYVHNSSETVKGKRIVRPIAASTCKPVSIDPTYTPTKPIGIIPKFYSLNPEKQGYDHWEMDLSEEIIDMGIILPVYHNSLKKYQVLEGLLKEKLVQASKKVFSFQEFQPGRMTTHLTDITTEIDNCGLTIVPVNTDGNCFFAAVSININFNPNLHSEKFTKMNNPESLSMKLREAFVTEITGDHRSIYENFVELNEGVNYMDEATKFLQSGYFASVLGDLMPLAMATILNSTILIFTRSSCSPMYVTPLSGQSEKTVFLIYDPRGPGHYDAALPYKCTNGPPHTVSEVPQSQTSCNCGVNKKHPVTSCAPNPVYSSRCKCYKQSKPCNSLCHCKSCSNPYGVKPCKQEGPTRQRRRHSMQEDVPSSKRFAEERGELVEAGTWSNFESIVLNEIYYIAEKDQNVDAVKLYDDVVYYAHSNFCTSPLPDNIVFRKKSSKQVTSKLSYIKGHN